MFQSVRKKGLLRQVYNALALIALLNLAVIVGGGGYLAASGTITADQIRSAMTALRGKAAGKTRGPSTSSSGASTSGEAHAAEQTTSTTVGSIDYSSETELEIARQEAERIKVELDQRLALSNAVLLKVRMEREQFEKDQESSVKQQQNQHDQTRDEGLEREVAIYESLAPKVAMQHLLGLSDVDEAAKILAGLTPTRAKKIIEAAKRGPELKQMEGILQRVRDVAPAKSKELSEEGGK